MFKKFLFLITFSTALCAFDTRTHVYVGQEILNDLQDGKLTIAPYGEFAVDPMIVSSIINNPSIFRMGTVGPDGYPDIAAGQVTAHPGLEDGWKSDDWLKWVLVHAKSEEELAFAYGYLSHASADVFAHTYINMYSGDHFDLADEEEDVELRHIYLETFISDHLPDLIDHNGQALGEAHELVAVSEQLPIDYLLNTLLLNDEVMAEYEKSGEAKYLYKLYELRKKILELDAYLNPIDNENDEKARVLLTEQARLEVKLDIAEEVCDSSFFDDIFGSNKTPDQLRACSDAENYEVQIDSLEDQLDELSTSILGFDIPTVNFSKRWVARIDHAAREYVKAASRVNQDFLRHEGNSFETMKQWLDCYTATFTDLSVVISDDASSCIETDGKIIQSHSHTSKRTQGIFDLDLGLDSLSNQYEKAKEIIDLVENNLGKAFVTLISDSAARMVTARDQMVDSDFLNQQFAKDLSNKNLLIIDDLAERVKLEMRLKNDKLDPQEYAVIYNAIIFSKLALLDEAGINTLLQKAGVSRDIYANTQTGEFNILFNAIKTMDGNHQWLETAPPYPRDNGVIDSEIREYSYSETHTHGLKLFSDEESRDKVFNTIFKGVLAPGLESPTSLHKTTLLASDYPYVTCNTIPFPNGVDDKRCLYIDDDVIIIEDPDDKNSTVVETGDGTLTVTTTWVDSLQGFVRSALSFIFEEGISFITEFIASILGSVSEVQKDGSFVSTTPTLKSLQSVSAKATVKIAPDGTMNATMYSKDSNNHEEIIDLPKLKNPEKVETKEGKNGSIDIIITTSIPDSGITF
jgi:hypothetical protein